MARRSLKPQLNQIRTWVRQGRTDAWIAHQLQVAVRDIAAFKAEHGLAPEGEEPEPFTDDLDLRAEDDALIAAELDAEPDDEEEEEGSTDEGEGEAQGGEKGDRPRRRRGRRGGRGRRKRKALDGTFDHGDDGYGLWLDPSIQEDSVYAEHWAGHRPVTVTVEPDRIIIRRAGEEEEQGDSEQGDSDSGSDKLDPDEFAA